VGVLTACSLLRRGMQVCLVDRASGPARMTSAANAGVIAPGFVAPFAAPGVPAKVLANLHAADRAFSWQPVVSPAQWRWILHWLGQCRQRRFEANRRAMLTLARYSQARLHALASSLNLDYRSTDSYWVVFRQQNDWDRARSLRASLEQSGFVVEALKGADFLDRHPALRNAHPIPHAALRVQGDEAGDCRAFVERVLRAQPSGGIVQRYRAEVESITVAGDGDVQLALHGGESIRCRHCVVSAGPWSAALLRPFLPRIPLYPIRGFSLTWELASSPPLSTALMDERYKIALTPLPGNSTAAGYRLRAAGMAHLGSPDPSHSADPMRQDAAAMTLWRVASSWLGKLAAPRLRADYPASAPSAEYPASAPVAEGSDRSSPAPELWCGARPMLPDGLPLIGSLGPRGLWVNTGHGSTGWAMAAGSADILASLLTGSGAPGIDPLPYQPQRWR